MPSALTYGIAKEVLNDSDLKRLTCCFFHSDHTKIDYEAAAKDYGSTTGSMRVMVNTSLRKVRAAVEAAGGGNSGDSGVADGGGADAPNKGRGRPAKKGTDGEAGEKLKRGRKRAAASIAEGDGDEEEVKLEALNGAKGTKGGARKKKIVKVDTDGGQDIEVGEMGKDGDLGATENGIPIKAELME